MAKTLFNESVCFCKDLDYTEARIHEDMVSLLAALSTRYFHPLHSYIDLLIAVGSKANSKERKQWNSALTLKILAGILNTPSYCKPVCDAESQVPRKKSTATVALGSKPATLLKFCTES